MFLATEASLREESSSSASVESGYSVHTDDVEFRVLGHGEPGEREKSLGQGGQLLIGRASEVSQSSGGIAASILHQKVRPVTGVDTVIIGKTKLAIHL